MAFSWPNTSAGTKLTAAQITDIRTNLLHFNTSILDKTPSESNISFTEPLTQYDQAKDLVMDEIQENLDYVKVRNWCRGYHSTYNSSLFGTQHATLHATNDLTENYGQAITMHTDYCTTAHSTRLGTNYASNNNTAHIVHDEIYHGSYRNGK